MQYSKPHQTPAQIVELLRSKGLDVADPAMLEARLGAVGYYRLKAYLHPFRRPDGSFVPGTSFSVVWSRYTFDRQLRLLVIDAIERVEVALRCHVMNALAARGGPFAHLDRANYNPNMDPGDFARFLDGLKDATVRSRDAFVTHYQQKYESPPGHRFTCDGIHWHHLPIWMACELMSFGSLLTLYRNLNQEDKRRISLQYDVASGVLESWLVTLNFVRNVCAHHGRLWNRVIPVQPLIPKRKKHPEWHLPRTMPSNLPFGVLTLLRYLMRYVAPQSSWQARLEQLLKDYPEVPREPMGFYPGWEASPIWSEGRSS